MSKQHLKLTMDNIEDRVKSRPKPTRLDTGNYYFVWGKTNRGKNYIDGPYFSEEDAFQGGYQAMDGDFKVVKLSTRDLRTATRIIKRMDLEETKSLEQSLMKARHKL